MNFRKPALTAVAAIAFGIAGLHGAAADTTIRAILEADLPTLDPVATTGAIPRYHGHMVYETLFSMDTQLRPHPVMVDDWSISDDELAYRFTLRDGLNWHDGAPVTSEDCIQSIKRWASKDRTFGTLMSERNVAYTVIDNKTFEIGFTAPLPLFIDGLAKVVSPVPFMMPKDIAETDANTPITDPTGSGPFIFSMNEWVPGSKVVYLRNPNYVPRSEPTDGLSGARIVNVDRVEWLIFNDSQAASAALRSGEVDFWETPNPELFPLLRSDPGITVASLNDTGVQGLLRLNHLQPPFDEPKAREAMYWLVNQRDILGAIVLDPSDAMVCGALFGCGTVYESNVASEALVGHDPERARALLVESGWDFSQPIEFMHVTTIPSLNAASLVFAQALRDIGLNVNLDPMDWATLTQRRANKGTPEEGGWNLFMTEGETLAMSNPITMPLHSAACDEAWFGWPCDEETERLRAEFADTRDLEGRIEIAARLQERSFTVSNTHIPLGQHPNPAAHRNELSGIVHAPFAVVFWGMEKR